MIFKLNVLTGSKKTHGFKHLTSFRQHYLDQVISCNQKQELGIISAYYSTPLSYKAKVKNFMN